VTVTEQLLQQGEDLGAVLGAAGVVVLGEVGIGNTTVAAALAASLLGLDADQVVGLGSGADTAMLNRKTEVVGGCPEPVDCQPRRPSRRGATGAAVGGVGWAGVRPAGRGGAGRGPRRGGHHVGRISDQRGRVDRRASRTGGRRASGRGSTQPGTRAPRRPATPGPATAAGLRLRAGEGVGAALGTQLLRTGLQLRSGTARTTPSPRESGEESPFPRCRPCVREGWVA